jgi:hypothetical protein
MENSLIVKLMLRVKHSLKLLQTIFFFSEQPINGAKEQNSVIYSGTHSSSTTTNTDTRGSSARNHSIILNQPAHSWLCKPHFFAIHFL